jgi:hypothetical protein
MFGSNEAVISAAQNAAGRSGLAASVFRRDHDGKVTMSLWLDQ